MKDEGDGEQTRESLENDISIDLIGNSDPDLASEDSDVERDEGEWGVCACEESSCRGWY